MSIMPTAAAGEPRSHVHVLSAVRADTGWLMRLEVLESGRPPRQLVVRVPAGDTHDEATARILAAVRGRRPRRRAASPA